MIFWIRRFLDCCWRRCVLLFCAVENVVKKAWAKMARVLSKVGQDFGKIFLIHRQKMSEIFLK